MISILMPTRGRPENLLRVYTSAMENATNPDEVEFCVYLDDDDTSTIQHLEAYGFESCTPVIGERIVLSEMWNRCYDVSSGDILMQCGDDIVFRSRGWDAVVKSIFDQYEDKIVLVHGRDGCQDARLATHGFLHRRWVETLGYFVPPYFSSDWNDMWLTEVADMIGRRRYEPSIFTDHMHPAFGKAEWDRTHQERLDRHRRDDVDTLYKELEPLRIEDAAKLRAVMDA